MLVQLSLLVMISESFEKIKNFESFQLPPKSVQSYSLLDYFSGDNLSYSADCTQEGVEFIVYQSFQQQVLAENSNESAVSNPDYPDFNMKRNIIKSLTYSFYFTKSSFIVIQTDYSQKTTQVVESININPNDPNFKIKGFSSVTITDEAKFLIFGRSETEGKNQFFLLENFTNGYNQIEVNIPELQNITDLQLGDSYLTEILCFNGTEENKKKLFLVKIIPNSLNFECFQKITSFQFDSNETNFNLQNFFLISRTGLIELLVLSDFYLIYFTSNGSDFNHIFNLSLSLYGEPLSMTPLEMLGHYNKSTLIKTTDGILVIVQENKEEFQFFKYPDYVKGQLKGYYVYGNFVYFMYVNQGSLALTAITTDYQNMILYDTLININNPDINGPWMFYGGIEGTYLLHVGNNNITMINFKSILPSFKVQNKDFEVNCTVEAHKNNLSLANNLSITIYDESPYTISKFYHGKKYLNDLKLKLMIDQKKTYFDIPLFMISGWNASCFFDSLRINDLVIEDVTKPRSKEIPSLKLSGFQDVIVRKHFLFVIYKDYIEIRNLTETNYSVVDVDNVVDVQVCFFSKSLNVFVLLQKFEEQWNVSALFVENSNYNESNIKQISSYEPGNFILVVYEKLLAISHKITVKIYKFCYDHVEFFNDLKLSNDKSIEHLALAKNTKDSDLVFIYVGYDDRISIHNLNTRLDSSFLVKDYQDSRIIGYQQLLTHTDRVYLKFQSYIAVVGLLFNNFYNQLGIDFDNFKILNCFIAGTSNNSIFILNGTETYLLESVFYIKNTNASFAGFTYDLTNRSILTLFDSDTIYLSALSFPSNNSTNTKTLYASITFNNVSLIKNSTYDIELPIKCMNDFSSLEFDYSINVETYGLKIQSKLEDFKISVNYDDEASYELSNFFEGYDLSYDLEFSDKFNENETRPAYIQNSTRLIQNISVESNITSLTLIKGSNSALLSIKNNTLMIVDLFNDSNKNILFPMSIYGLFCPLIELISDDSSICFIAAMCINSTNKVSYLALINLYRSNGTLQVLRLQALNYSYYLMNVLIATDNLFIVGLVEYMQADYANNHVEIFQINLTGGLSLTYLANLNYFTLGLSTFFCYSIEGEFLFNGKLSLYLADRLFGIRVVEKVNNSFILTQNISLYCKISSIGSCGKQLYLACSDTKVYLYRKINGKFNYLESFYPFNNNQDTYNAMAGYMDCDDFYLPTLVVMPIAGQSSYAIRIFESRREFSSAILKDVVISEEAPQNEYNTCPLFFNQSVFVAFDSWHGIIKVYEIVRAKMVVPGLSDQDVKSLEKIRKNLNFTFSVYVKNNFAGFFSKGSFVYRGKDKNGKSSDDDDAPFLWTGVIVAAVFIFMILVSIIAFLVYKRNRNRRFNRPVTELHLSLNYFVKGIDLSSVNIRKTTVN